MHPLALKGENGANGMKAGDRVVYTIDGKHGVADEFLHDGDAFVTFDDGSFETVKWNHLMPERSYEGELDRLRRALQKIADLPVKPAKYGHEKLKGDPRLRARRIAIAALKNAH